MSDEVKLQQRLNNLQWLLDRHGIVCASELHTIPAPDFKGQSRPLIKRINY